MKTHILFDLGHTLIHFDAEWNAVFKRALSAVGPAAVAAGLPVDGPALIERFGRRMKAYYEQRERDLIESTTLHVLRETLAAIGAGSPDNAVLDEILSAFYRVTQGHWKTIPGACQILQALRNQGFRLAILSNAAYDADVQFLVDRSALRPYLDFVLTSAVIGLRKPHPAAFRRALEEWGVAPEAVFMVGDTLAADILGARNSGLASIWIKQYALKPRREPYPADFELETLAELPELTAAHIS